MNGRCENDALDGAIDVCDACGGEFCGNCLLFPNGPKKAPLCTACAISTSGVRKAAKRERLQSKSSASKRRKELRALAAEQQTQSLVMLEDFPDVELPPAAEAKPKKRRLRRKSDAAAEAAKEAEEKLENPILDDNEFYEHDAFVPLDFDGESAPGGSASKLIDEIRTNGAVEHVTSNEADMWNLPTEYSEPDNDHYDQLAPAFQSEPKFEAERILEPEPTLEPEQVFETNPANPTEPGLNLEHVFDSTAAAETGEADEPHQWETLHNPDASNPFDDPSVSRVASGSPASDSPAPAPAPAPKATKKAKPAKKERRLNRVPAPQHRSPSPTGSQALPAPAPLIQPEPEHKRLRLRDMVPAEAEAPEATAPAPPAPRPKVQDPTNDTDASGQWIPPNLRGMAPVEEQTELPKRTRRGS